MTTEIPLYYYLVVSTVLFCVGLGGVLAQRNAILSLVGIELMLNAANLNLIAFWRYSPQAEQLGGVMFVLFSLAVAAAEAAVGLALIILVYRHFQTIHLDELPAEDETLTEEGNPRS